MTIRFHIKFIVLGLLGQVGSQINFQTSIKDFVVFTPGLARYT